MKRWHDDFKIAFREWKKHRKTHVESNIRNSKNRIGKKANEIDCTCDEQIGRFRKKDAYDCGNARCYVCHSDKLMKCKRRKEEINDISFKEQLNDRLDRSN